MPYMPDHVGMRRNDSSRQMQFLREGGGKLAKEREIGSTLEQVYSILSDFMKVCLVRS